MKPCDFPVCFGKVNLRTTQFVLFLTRGSSNIRGVIISANEDVLIQYPCGNIYSLAEIGVIPQKTNNG